MTFLINGTAIDYLCEIPDGCSILFVNQLVKCEFWQNFSLFHRIPPLKPHQLNCFQYLINSRFRPFEINQILTDQKVVRAILSECECTADSRALSLRTEWSGKTQLRSLFEIPFGDPPRLRRNRSRLQKHELRPTS